ncbi:MAG: Holliday junction resolvase RuvX [Lachnospiraceae bacterium]|nr:Holliday junction resolvase RuvX [Lachnospiraceae bacterium]MBO4783446.1 Holliday junction resolvase RuvX [Lachnospiraceae bacterium]MBP5494210.1 Holliday junction resolvase RuvX [Lachnospiraceae bacterium]MBR5066186.1 Holliday junction resolvase RuvX [Lachnospiraceae bacterium]MBR5917266.1 Holliday junction resolvase RuvX [Lachnospiraceae bacterium]
MNNERLMGLDFGSKTVGVALSDPTGLIASPLEIIEREREDKLRKTFSRIEELIEEYKVTKIVLGLPLNMDSSEGERVRKTEEFKEALERRTGLEIVFWDERLSTVEAHDIMTEAGVKGIDRKKFVDKIAASIILQGYMDSQKEK